MCACPLEAESLISNLLIPPEPLVQGRKRATAQVGNAHRYLDQLCVFQRKEA